MLWQNRNIWLSEEWSVSYRLSLCAYFKSHTGPGILWDTNTNLKHMQYSINLWDPKVNYQERLKNKIKLFPKKK